jgi:hypothetical protein
MITKSFIQNEIERLKGEHEQVQKNGLREAEELNGRIQQYTVDRDNTIAKVNRDLSFVSGRINQLEQLLAMVDNPVNGEVSQEMAKVLHE